MGDVFGDTIHWKKMWQLTAGFNNESTTEFVSKQLTEIQTQLQSGLLYYKQRSQKSLETLKNEKIKKDFKLKNLLERLEKFLGIDALQLWDILCYYLVTEFRGSPTALINFTLSEMKIVQLIIDIWGFYTSERMFMLKLLGVIIEYHNDSLHPYCNEYADILNKITLDKIRNSLIEQFKSLIKEVAPSIKENGDICTPHIQNLWAERNMREQIQILNLLILTINVSHITPSELEQLLELFKEHNFGKQQSYVHLLSEKHNEHIKKITYFEVVLFLVCMDISNFKEIDMNKWIGKYHKSLDSLIMSLHFNEEHGPLLLSWMLFNFDYKGEEAYHTRYSQFGNKALQLNVFGFLHNIILHSSFKDKSKLSIVTYKTVYNLLSDLCNKFDGEGSISQHAFVFELSAELLSARHIAHDFCDDLDTESGMYSVWNSAIELFPHKIVPLSVMADGLAKCGGRYHNFIMNKLNCLNIYTELYDPYRVRLVPVESGSEACITQEPYQPLPSVAFTIPAGTTAVLHDRKNQTLVHFGACVNYWTVLHAEIIQLIEQSGAARQDDLIERARSGVRLIASCVRHVKHPDDIPEQMVLPTEMVFDVIQKFMRAAVDPPMELLTACLEVFVNLTPLFGGEVQKRLCSINLLPCLNNLDLTHIEYVHGESFQSNGIGYYLINVARSSGKYQFIMAYFNLLTAFFNLDVNNVMEIELPGLIFILREIFPHVRTWHFEDELERQTMLYHCVQYFLNVLQLTQDQIAEHREKEILHKTCLSSLLDMENGTALLKLIAVGNPYLQAVMEEQSNWAAGPGVQCIRLVQLSIATLMQILRLKSLVLERNTLAPLEYVIYTQPKQKDTLRIVPTVTGYMNHVFNKHLPSLACRLLKRFALEIQMSLMACLDMESDQIRQLFLQRLRDESESEDLKTAILELVAACVERQPGLTEAFFKVHHPQDKAKVFYRPQGEDIAEGVLSYMAEYLSVVHKDPVRLCSPLLGRIMNLFHALWKNHMEMLVADFRKDTKFWKYFTSPLFHKIRPDIKAYSQILNIIGIELFQSQGVIDDNLKGTLETLFDPKMNYLNALLDHIFALPTDRPALAVDEIPEWLCLLTSWKDFMTISIRLLPFDLQDSLKQACLEKCLATLIAHIRNMNDLRTVILLSELCMVMLSRWKNGCINKNNIDRLARQTATIMQCTYLSYECLHHRAREALLATAIHLIRLLMVSNKIDDGFSNLLMEPVCQILCLEMNAIADVLKTVKQDNKNPAGATDVIKHLTFSRSKPDVDHSMLSCVLSFSALNQILLSHKSGLSSWASAFSSTCLVNRILSCLNTIIPNQGMMKVTLSAFYTLTHLARGTFSKLILDFGIGQYLWLSLLPPKNLMKDNIVEYNSAAWKVTDWWQVYRGGIDLVRAVLEHNAKTFSLDAIVFASAQEEYLVDAILLPGHSLAAESIQLTIAVLELVDELLKHQDQWRSEHETSLMNIMRAIQIIADYCVSLIHRPRMLRCHIDGVAADMTNSNQSSITSKPSEKVIFAVNKLLDIIALSSRCLSAVSPSVLKLLTESNLDLSKWKPLVEVQFGAPKLNTIPNSSLTFGTIMSAVCLLTKSLSYTYKAKGKYLNRLSGTLDQSKVEDYLLTSSESDTSNKEAFGIKKTVQTIQPSSQIANMSAGTSSMLLSTDWLTKFNTKHTLFALENLLTFLASQALFLTRDPSVTNRDQQLVRRELSSELYAFHEFVRKKVSTSSKNILCRRKLGTSALESRSPEHADSTTDESSAGEDDEVGPETSATPKRASEATQTSRRGDSMRVNVVRKQHLESARTPTATTKRTSPRAPVGQVYQPRSIVLTSAARPPPDSVEALLHGLRGVRSVSAPQDTSPVKAPTTAERPSLDLTGIPKHVMWMDDSAYPGSPMSVSPRDEPPAFTPDMLSPIPHAVRRGIQDDATLAFLPPENDADRYYPLTDVLMYEEDYLHFLSYLFMYICPMDNY